MQMLLHLLLFVSLNVWSIVSGATMRVAAQGMGSAAAPTGDLAPQIQPLRTWTIAPDGALFVLDSDATLHELAVSNLQPVAQSSPVFPMQPRDSVHLVADDAYVIVGNEALTQTVVLDRDTLLPLYTLEAAGIMALDPGHRLFMKRPYTPDQRAYSGTILVYNLADLPQVAQTLETDCITGPIIVEAVGRRLLVTVGNCPSSPPHRGDSFQMYDLDTLEEEGRFIPDPFRGDLDRAAVAGKNGRGVTVNHGLNGIDDLHLFNVAGEIIQSQHAILAGTQPAIDSEGRWLYLLNPRGLAVLRTDDLSIHSFAPFTNTIVSDIALSPDDELLYLFNASGVMTQSTAALQQLGVQPLSPFPQAWLQSTETGEQLQARLYPAPVDGDNATVFLHLEPLSWGETEIFRSHDGGSSWHPLPVLHGYALPAIGISPDFAEDQTLTIGYRRSTDGGETWQSNTPEIAFVSDSTGSRELYTMPLYVQSPRRVTYHAAADENPAWSPAQTRLAFQSDRLGDWDIFSVRADCATAIECDLRQLTHDAADDLLPAWSPDGRMIAFVSLRNGNAEIYVMESDGSNERRLTFHPSGDWRPAWLPDSKHLLFVSTRSGNNDIYSIAVPALDEPLTAEPELTPVVTSPADDRDPTVTTSTALAYSFDFEQENSEAGQEFYVAFLSDLDGAVRTYITTLKAGTPEPYTDATDAESHPNWFDNNVLLLAIERESGSDIYQVTLPHGAPRVVYTSPGFDGQPAGGATWWLPDAATAAAWLRSKE